MTIPAICQQLEACCGSPAPFFDTDEWRCRVCGRSLTVPPRDARKGENPGEDRDAGSPEFDPPRLLRCSCCEEMLPPLSFTVRNHESAKNRQYRASICRPCTAFRMRVKREQNPEAARARDRQNGEKFRADHPGHFNKPKTPAQREDNRLAVTRLKARKAGLPVLRQRPGKLAVLVKPVCRIAADCPLRPYCTTENKGLA